MVSPDSCLLAHSSQGLLFFFRNQELASFPTPLRFWALSSHLFFKYLHLKLPREECWWVSPTTPVRSSHLWIFQQFHCSILEIPTDSYSTWSCSVEFGFWETEWEKPLGKFFWCRSPWLLVYPTESSLTFIFWSGSSKERWHWVRKSIYS